MELTGNTILITGGSSGIGKGLALAFHKLGNRVIIAGRREDALKAVSEAHPGMTYLVMDVSYPADISRAAGVLLKRFPDLNVLINNAGVQRVHDFAADSPIDDNGVMDEINTNLLGVIRCCAEFVPHLKRARPATVINVSSGLAFVPLSRFPVYCATKAAVHSFCLSLRHQLRNTSVKVIELIPPYVATELDRDFRGALPHGAPQPMPLEAFISEAMRELATGGEELAVAEAKRLRAAGVNEAIGPSIFTRLNP